ncbi:ATP-binding cassette domain-containing protein [Paratractidigestivibacter sp.]|uniref:ATP-binding cassette domain-containing protein n=1 Tax=Paratractidigestivibacter sp. TaxID=2847316 RepID=UPI002AC8A3DF|nr:ATP-binding cassette domain-containing protein [Paratractidigestivibacter sp.]
MSPETLHQFKTIGEIQSCIARADTLGKALREGLAIFARELKAEAAIIWRADNAEVPTLRPMFWVGPEDLTSRSHVLGEGAPGRVFATQKSERRLAFAADPDPATQADFETIDIKSMACVPASGKTSNLGCLQVINKTDGGYFTDDDVDVLEIMAMSAAIALEDNEKFAAPWTPSRAIIEARGITREFQNGDDVTRVLKGVNLNVYDGELLVVLGESGCGKSTFLNIIGGMDRATSGSFTFEGKELSQATQAELTEYRRKNIGFIFQSYNLMPNLTALQNLRLIAELVDDPMDCEDALRLVGLGDRMGSYPSQLSGGQQQRVSIARALVKRPKLIFADEPTAALDYTTSIDILSALEEVVHAGTTLVMVTHNEEITRMADRVVRFRNGYTHEVTVNRHPVHATDLVW